jgi:hypothetical protein
MSTPIEFYYGETLRWAYGFENPNKAAVLFACLLPILWAAWLGAWRVRSGPWRFLVLLGSAAAFIGCAFFLFMTFSRGGVVAAVAGAAYVAWREWKAGRLERSAGIAESGGSSAPAGDGGERPWQAAPTSSARRTARSTGRSGRLAMKRIASGGLLLGVAGLAVWLGLASRSLEPITEGDGAVGNRIVLWRYALQMAADNPSGFGTGKSGEAYMNWYQPLETTHGYRTMVNSYLTFLVEQGWLAFAAAVFSVAVFWTWTGRVGAEYPRRSGDFETIIGRMPMPLWIAGLRGCLLSFAVAGIFSTVMEEAVLWVLPSLSAILLAALTLTSKRLPNGRQFIVAGAASAAVCILLWGAGLVLANKDSLVKRFDRSDDGEFAATISPREHTEPHVLWVAEPDAAVLGAVPGRLLRRLCLASGSIVHVGAAPRSGRVATVLAGAAAIRTPSPISGTLILIAPAIVPDEQAAKLLYESEQVVVFVPGIDEDGRAAFWRHAVARANGSNVRLVPLEGVGVQVDWGWDQVTESVRKL